MARYICIHGHFYQPPRENPWLEEVELQESAYPYHDWNERIAAECYAPNTASRIFDDSKRILDIVNNYARMSFNFGPTLLSWMERHRPEIHEAIITADHLSQKRFSGHGSALAQVYNHMIMPLANNRDKRTQVIWGIRDFQKRFGRLPEGMWLPETAVDTATLEILAENGIIFTILAPRQAWRFRLIGSREWKDVHGGHIDPTMAYLCRLPSGKSINLFFYDGPISGDIAFGGLLDNGEVFAKRLVGAFSEKRNWPQLVHIATDGETYGHHHSMGDMALAFCLDHIESAQLATITIYAEYLEKHPPTHEVQIIEKSSWSCIHGVERWRSDCGCCSGMHPGWNQEWRMPLRNAMDLVRDWITPFYEHEAGKYLIDPWAARNDYIEVILDRSRDNVEKFLSRHASIDLDNEQKSRVLRLLEMQRHAMLAFTSCGWFFDEISGLESTQIMRYAARAVQLAEEIWGVRLEPYLKDALSEASSNIPEIENGAKAYEKFVSPSMLDLTRVGAHLAVSSIFRENIESSHIFCYSAQNEFYEKIEAGSNRLGVGRTRIISDITWEEATLSYTTLYQGGHDVTSGISCYMDDSSFAKMQEEVKSAFLKCNVSRLVRVIDKYFGSHQYTLWHLFRDEQQEILRNILNVSMYHIEQSFRKIVERNSKVMEFLRGIDMPIPKPLAVTAEFVLNRDFQSVFEQDEPDVEQLAMLINGSKKWSVKLDTDALGYKASQSIDRLITRLALKSSDVLLLERIDQIFDLLATLKLDLNLWKAQNACFALAKEVYPAIAAEAEEGGPSGQRWIEAFCRLCDHLRIQVV